MELSFDGARWTPQTAHLRWDVFALSEEVAASAGRLRTRVVASRQHRKLSSHAICRILHPFGTVL
jgi:hypothetical protein